jgi:plasmid stabilization system protein ParE
MVYKIIFKKRFQNKLQQLLEYIEKEFGLLVAQRFARQLEKKLIVLQQQPFVGQPSVYIQNIRSIHAGKHNRLYYTIEGNKIIIINMYDTRINPKKNRLK